MPLRGIHHISLTVSDVDASAEWYQRVLGFIRTGEANEDGGARRRIFLVHDGLGATFALCAHRSSASNVFDETRVGLDHISFGVGTHAELEAWRQRLLEHGVDCSEPSASRGVAGALLVAFRDPDHIQLEFFAKEDDASGSAQVPS